MLVTNRKTNSRHNGRRVPSWWMIDGVGGRNEPWTRCVHDARAKAVSLACDSVRAGGGAVEVSVVGPYATDTVVVDAAYVAAYDREAAEREAARVRNAAEYERACREAVERHRLAAEKALPVARSLGLVGVGGSYRTWTDDTGVWVYVDGPGFGRDQLPNYLAAVRLILQHARTSGWASVFVDGKMLDVAEELAHDSWCRKWVLGVSRA